MKFLAGLFGKKPTKKLTTPGQKPLTTVGNHPNAHQKPVQNLVQQNRSAGASRPEEPSFSQRNQLRDPVKLTSDQYKVVGGPNRPHRGHNGRSDGTYHAYIPYWI